MRCSRHCIASYGSRRSSSWPRRRTYRAGFLRPGRPHRYVRLAVRWTFVHRSVIASVKIRSLYRIKLFRPLNLMPDGERMTHGSHVRQQQRTSARLASWSIDAIIISCHWFETRKTVCWLRTAIRPVGNLYCRPRLTTTSAAVLAATERAYDKKPPPPVSHTAFFRLYGQVDCACGGTRGWEFPS